MVSTFEKAWRCLEEESVGIIGLGLPRFTTPEVSGKDWEKERLVDLIKIGVPLPSTKITFKIVFTTRFIDICGLMEAHNKIKVECLNDEEAWELFCKKVQGLTEVPDIWKWEGLRRVSLMSNKTEKLSEIPSDPHLLTLLLQRQVISSFTMLQVLKMFGCGRSSSDREPHQKIAFYLEAVNF
ncbi:hypothetical protein WN944_022412 [Citrus x changshan-huyou]|uniref:NB-ARC domain-containing protein n=1 Tax=Citrus x changshan-huyou TaxID=2935761 RepID=A0AAP0MYD9_9ROSI